MQKLSYNCRKNNKDSYNLPLITYKNIAKYVIITKYNIFNL